MHGFDAIEEHFSRQAKLCGKLGSPFYAELLPRLSGAVDQESQLGRVLINWKSDLDEDAVALRLAAAVHYLALCRRDNRLTNRFPPQKNTADEFTFELLSALFELHEGVFLEFLKSAPQTNEVGRSMALLGGFLLIVDRLGRDLDIFEVGASAGLNLAFDHYHYRADSWHWGAPDSLVKLNLNWTGTFPPAKKICIHKRVGCDLNPIFPHSDENKILSYIWPDQVERMARTHAAIQQTKTWLPEVENRDVINWLKQHLTEAAADRVQVVYHSIVWQYLQLNTQHQFRELIEQKGAQATERNPLVWMRFEPSADKTFVELRLTIWPKAEQRLLAHCGYHGEWVDWKFR